MICEILSLLLTQALYPSGKQLARLWRLGGLLKIFFFTNQL
jgi:hypothetical protein